MLCDFASRANALFAGIFAHAELVERVGGEQHGRALAALDAVLVVVGVLERHARLARSDELRTRDTLLAVEACVARHAVLLTIAGSFVERLAVVEAALALVATRGHARLDRNHGRPACHRSRRCRCRRRCCC